MAFPDLKIYKLYPDVKFPEFATMESACFDLEAYIKPEKEIRGFDASNDPLRIVPTWSYVYIKPQERLLIPTGIIFEIPKGYSLRIHPRSGVSYKTGLNLANCEGVIDSDYYYETFILLINNSDEDVVIKDGNKIAQAEMVPCLNYNTIETDVKPKQSTDRIGGLGSTGD